MTLISTSTSDGQIRLVSANVRAYTNVPESDKSPNGNQWDMLWIGHCGTAMTENNPGLRYRDETRCNAELYSGWSRHFLRDFLEEDYRIIQWAGSPTVCTFGIGVHRQSVQKLLDVAVGGADEAYDVALSHACGTGKLKCLVVNPQIMNHYEPPKDTGYLSPVHVGDQQGPTKDDSQFEKEKGHHREYHAKYTLQSSLQRAVYEASVRDILTSSLSSEPGYKESACH